MVDVSIINGIINQLKTGGGHHLDPPCTYPEKSMHIHTSCLTHDSQLIIGTEQKNSSYQRTTIIACIIELSH